MFVGLMYTFVSTHECLLSSWVLKKGSMLLLSVSMVNLIEEWHRYKISRKLTADVVSGMIVKYVIHISPVVCGHLAFTLRSILIIFIQIIFCMRKVMFMFKRHNLHNSRSKFLEWFYCTLHPFLIQFCKKK